MEIPERKSQLFGKFSEFSQPHLLPRRQTKTLIEEIRLREEIVPQSHKKHRHHSKSIDDQYDEVGSSVKRERLRLLRSKLRVASMKQALPVYGLAQIREFRLPFHEALTINLKEGGFSSSAAYLRSLIDFQDKERKAKGPGSSIFVLPLLKFAKNELGQLTHTFKTAEIYHGKKMFADECHVFLQLAVDFAFGVPDWWWLGEQLLIQSIRVSSMYSSIIGDKYVAYSRYAYGKYLLENVKEYADALEQLELTRHLAANKVWTSKNFFPNVRGTLFMQTNQAIFECIMDEVKHYMTSDVDKALILADQARKRAAEACFRDGETKALVLRGICEMSIKRPKAAINSFLRAIGIQEKFGTIEETCKIRIHLAKAYLMDDCANASLNILMELKRDAELHNLPYYVGQAYKSLGEYYLMIGKPDKASPLLEESINIFDSCNIRDGNIEVVKNLKAISGGLQIFPKYVDVLINAGIDNRYGRSSLIALLEWKNERLDFWGPGHDIVPYTSCDQIIVDSLKKVEEGRLDVINERFERLSAKSVNAHRARPTISFANRTVKDYKQAASLIEVYHPKHGSEAKSHTLVTTVEI